MVVGYPWRCLCFGFSQITRTTPWRLMILHLSHIFFTDGLTFTMKPPFSPRARIGPEPYFDR